MNTNQSDLPTIVCDLTAIPADARERHVRNAPRIFQAVEEIRELADGYEFRLPNEGGMWLALATFVENERRCCPFYRFGLTVEANNGPLWLALTGPEGSKELLTIALGGSSAEGLIFLSIAFLEQFMCILRTTTKALVDLGVNRYPDQARY